MSPASALHSSSLPPSPPNAAFAALHRALTCCFSVLYSSSVIVLALRCACEGTWHVDMTAICGTACANTGHDAFICTPCCIHVWHVTLFYERRDFFIVGHESLTHVAHVHMCNVSCWHVQHKSMTHVHMCNVSHWLTLHMSLTHVANFNNSRLCVNDSCPHVQCELLTHVAHGTDSRCTCATWLVQMWGMTHSDVRHDEFIGGTWHIYTRDMTYWFVGHDSLICGTWLVQIWDMTQCMLDSCVWYDSFICGRFICGTFICGTRLIHIWDMTHSYVGHDHLICGT